MRLMDLCKKNARRVLNLTKFSTRGGKIINLCLHLCCIKLQNRTIALVLWCLFFNIHYKLLIVNEIKQYL